jgi:hypothetical protein
MEWRVMKTGANLFDLLHTYGLGIVLAHACGQPIEVRETGPLYTLTGDVSTPPSGPLALLDTILALPTPQEIEAARLPAVALPIATLDGLLTVLFTTPGGVRVLSVADLQWKSRRDPSVVARALEKARVATQRWKASASSEPSRGTETWVEQVLQDYDATAPACPVPADARPGQDLSLLMMLDPSFSYSTHRPRSDGLVSVKTQVALRGTRFAVLLAIIGAARFLRAQRIGNDLVNCYVPKAAWIRLKSDSSAPLVFQRDAEAFQAALLQWLACTRTAARSDATLTGVVYQTIRTQGAQQSIPADRGCLDLTWFTTLPVPLREALSSFWQMLLLLPPERRSCEIDALVDALMYRSQDQWITHLLEVARRVHADPENMRSYTLEEVKEVTFLMQTSIPSLLKKALEQKAGTLRFGQAMRLLGESNAGALRDLIEELETVTTLDQLLHALALTAQHCQVAAAKTKFMVVPSEDDLSALLLDVEQASPQTIARFLIVLSALRYPRVSEEEYTARQLTQVIFFLLSILTNTLADHEEQAQDLTSSPFSEGEQHDQNHPESSTER